MCSLLPIYGQRLELTHSETKKNHVRKTTPPPNNTKDDLNKSVCITVDAADLWTPGHNWSAYFASSLGHAVPGCKRITQNYVGLGVSLSLSHTHTHTHAHTNTHALLHTDIRTHARAHTHTHTVAHGTLTERERERERENHSRGRAYSQQP